jgi:glycosidase
MSTRIKSILYELYGRSRAENTYKQLCEILSGAQGTLSGQVSAGEPPFPMDQSDAVLITYGDQFHAAGQKPLATLHDFLSTYVKGVISGVHILPFFPYSSDDGFSIIDYTKVDPRLGTWRHIQTVAHEFKLMCDLVLNHISQKSMWFNHFLQGDPGFADYFITIAPATDLSQVARPRALPLLHTYSVAGKDTLVWTTFSEDQIDLNYKNPRVLLEMIKVLLLYLGQGAKVIRLDAIAYVWKEAGTACIHLHGVYLLVELFREIVNVVAPRALLITETNVPHKENISYLGDGSNGAHMVYQFSLPPLVLHTFKEGDASALSKWARSLTLEARNCTFFNFLASHDGVGVLPLHGILPPRQIDDLVHSVEKRGGRISYKNTDKGAVPYELNISYLNAITDEHDPPQLKAKKFLAAHAIMLALKGVPGIYIHSLIGSTNYDEGVEKTGINRTINRQKLALSSVAKGLAQKSSLRSCVYSGFVRLLRARSSHPAFHPLAPQHVMETRKELFVIRREALTGDKGIVCLHNTASCKTEFRCSARLLGLIPGRGIRDIISNTFFDPKQLWKENVLRLQLDPYQVLWLAQEKPD